MANEETKNEKPICKKCFGMNERKVLRFVIPCAASFIGCLLALAVYASLSAKPPIPGHCPPPPPFHQMQTPHQFGPDGQRSGFRPDRPHDRHGQHFAKQHRGDYYPDRPDRPHMKKDRHHRDIDLKRGPDPRTLKNSKDTPQPKNSDNK